MTTKPSTPQWPRSEGSAHGKYLDIAYHGGVCGDCAKAPRVLFENCLLFRLPKVNREIGVLTCPAELNSYQYIKTFITRILQAQLPTHLMV